MGKEFELKFRADEEKIAAIAAKYGDFTSISMETTYYDTPAKDLSALHWTLRRRYENGTSVCTLKTPAPGGARGEWETECPDILSAIPELCKLGAPAELDSLCHEGLVISCGAMFTRRAGTFTLRDCVLEIALDQGVLLGGGRELPFCELEVEHKEGSREAVEAFARQLADIYALKPEEKSKFARALALRKEE